MSYFLFGPPEQVAKEILDYAGDAPVQTVWLGASVAGLPEDLAARHVQTICTRLAPLLAGTQTRAAVPVPHGLRPGEAADGP
jgi:hypothetical protein